MTGVVSPSSCGRNSTIGHKGHEDGEYVTGEITAAPVIIKLKWHDFITCHSIASMNELYKHSRGVGHHWSVKKADESANYILGAVGEYAVAKYLGKFYEVEGRHYPQTLETPAEYPELLILSATIAGTTFDLSKHLSWHDIETLKESVKESLSDQT